MSGLDQMTKEAVEGLGRLLMSIFEGVPAALSAAGQGIGKAFNAVSESVGSLGKLLPGGNSVTPNAPALNEVVKVGRSANIGRGGFAMLGDLTPPTTPFIPRNQGIAVGLA